MPIRPEARWLYPIDWRELSGLVRFGRANGICEPCGRPHGQEVVHLADGRWWDEERQAWRDRCGRRVRGLPPLDGTPVSGRSLGTGPGNTTDGIQGSNKPGPGRFVGAAPGDVPRPASAPILRLEPPAPAAAPGAAVPLGLTRVVLAAAHLDHDPGHNRLSNLAALCQACHMRHDAPEHRRTRHRNAFRQRAMRDLFDPPGINEGAGQAGPTRRS